MGKQAGGRAGRQAADKCKRDCASPGCRPVLVLQTETPAASHWHQPLGAPDRRQQCLAVQGAGAYPRAVAAALLLLLLLHLIQKVAVDLAGGGADVSICSSHSQGARVCKLVHMHS